MDSTRTARYDAYKAVRGLVNELRGVKLFGAEADSVLWAAEGLLLANSPTDAEAVQARKAFDVTQDQVRPWRAHEVAMRMLNNLVMAYHRRGDLGAAIHAATLRLALPADASHRDILQGELRAIQARLN